MMTTCLPPVRTGPAPLALPAGAVLFRQGDGPGEAVWVVEQGLMRLEHVAEEGARRIVGLVGVGELLGHDGLCGLPHACEAVACSDVRLRRVSLAGLDAEPLAAARLLRLAALALATAQAWTAEVVAGAAADRVRHLLARLAEHEDADGLCWLPSRQEMAAMLDLRHETVSRHVSALRQQGLIGVSQGSRARLQGLRRGGAPARVRPLLALEPVEPLPPPGRAERRPAVAAPRTGRPLGSTMQGAALALAGLLGELAWLD